MSFETYYRKHGVAIVEHALADRDIVHMERAFERAGAGGSGLHGGRQVEIPADVCDWLETHPTLIELATRMLRAPASLVRILTFDKTKSSNWFVPWHQDRSVALEDRHRVNGFRNWVQKDGYWQVEPPVWLLEQTLVLRVHLDRCGIKDGPLEVLTGTHGAGRLKRAEISELAKSSNLRTCLADRGDILALSPLTVHRSRRAIAPTHRRVLHLEYCAAELPEPLQWASLTPQVELALEQMEIW